MSISDKLNVIIEKRKKIEDDIDYERNPVIAEEVELISENEQNTVQFLKNECTGEQIVWLSEVFDEIIAKTKSEAIYEALQETILKYPKEAQEYNLQFFIESAEEYLGE